MSARDDVLLWLNDRLGKSVSVSVQYAKGDVSVTVLEIAGELQHWRQRARAEGHERAAARTDYAAREHLVGWYAVGDANLDVSDLGHLAVTWRHELGELQVDLAEDVTLSIVEQVDFSDEE